jgi:hypothetical protein
MSKFIEVPQEVEEWIGRLTEKDMIPMAVQAVQYAINYLGRPYWNVLSDVIDLCCQDKGAIPLKGIPVDEEILLQTVRETIELVSQRLEREPEDVAAEALAAINHDPRVAELATHHINQAQSIKK